MNQGLPGQRKAVAQDSRLLLRPAAEQEPVPTATVSDNLPPAWQDRHRVRFGFMMAS